VRVLALILAAGVAPAEAAQVAVVITGQSARGDALRKTVRQILAGRPGLQLLDEARETHLFTLAPAPSLTAVERLLARAEMDFREFDLSSAEKALQEAATALEPHLGLRSSLNIDQQRLHLAVAVAHAQRNDARITQLLAEYAARYVGDDAAAAPWPPDLKARLVQLRFPIATALVVHAEPSGQAYLDGRLLGPTPAQVDGLPPGRHRIEVEAPGYAPANTWIETTSAKVATASLVLEPSLGTLFVAIAPPTIPADLGERLRPHDALREVATLILVAPGAQGQISLARYEIHTGQFIPWVGTTPKENDLQAAISALFAPILPPPAPPPRPVVWWPWVTAGAGAVALGGGIAFNRWAHADQADYFARQGALTQADAYSTRDSIESRALVGTLLITVGAAALAGGLTFGLWDFLE